MSTKRDDGTWSGLACRLQDAHGFVDVALVTCMVARAQELRCAVSLLSRTGLPLINVEHVDVSETPFAYSAPISGLTEQIGVIRWSSHQPIDNLRDAFAVAASHVAMRLAQLGHTSSIAIGQLVTPRQLETASLAVRGHTNVEIADQLGVSENTVKKHLADVFDRLHVAGRTALARHYGWLATLDLLPVGVTHIGDCRITRIYPVRP